MGAIMGVAANELWRTLRPPEEVRLLRRLLNDTMPTPTVHPLQAGQPYVAALIARYRRPLLHARLTRAACWLCLVSTLALSGQPWMTLPAVIALLLLASANAVASIVFQRRADAVLRTAERKPARPPAA